MKAAVVVEMKFWKTEVWEENTVEGLEGAVRSGALEVTSMVLVVVSWATVLMNGLASVSACAKAKDVDLLIFSC